MKFRMVSDIVFEAEDLDGAFKKLSNHLIKLQQGYASDGIEITFYNNPSTKKDSSHFMNNNNSNKGNL